MKKIIRVAGHLVSWFDRAANYLQSPLLLAIRMYWGWQFFQTGLGKLNDIEKVTDFFTSLGIPQPELTAHMVGGLECVGGALLFFGLGSRLIALPLTINMLVAYLAADREALSSIFSDPAKFYAADPFTFLLASLLILALGPGRLSLDWVLGYLRSRHNARLQLSQKAAVSTS